jgi:hypothetical protein
MATCFSCATRRSVAQAFDVTRLALSGDPVPIADQIQTAQAPPSGAFAVSDHALAYPAPRPVALPRS